MIEAVATVPHPPLLVEALAGTAADETVALRAACRAAAARLADAADRWVAVGSDPRAGEWGPGARGTFRGFGTDLVVALGPGGDPAAADPGDDPGADGSGADPDPALPLPLLVAGWLRDGLDPARRPAVRGVVLEPGTTPADAAACGRAIAADAAAAHGPTGLLVLADGAATHSARAPGTFDPRAEAFDDAVAAALATADVDALGALEPALADALWAGGRVGWQILAGAAAGTRWDAEVLHRSEPFGVAYHVAVWERARPQPGP